MTRYVIALIAAWLVWVSVTTGQAAKQVVSSDTAHLGTVDFKRSCSTAVQPKLEKGVALLHSFQYQEAKQTFQEATAQEPKCAMAHWGNAISKYEQIWDLPNKQALKEGHKEIQQAQKLHPSTAKEQGFLTAAAAYYQKDSHIKYSGRLKAYSDAMAKLHEQMPEDVEVGSFYALSLVALANDDVDSLQDQKKAIAILQPLLQKYPDHPGVAHYLIHAADRPELAPEGLEAARRYAAIAPDSPHALHMPSHIFVRLGLWQDSIQSNIASAASGARLAAEHKAEAHYQFHARDFLNYSYVQSGQESKAREVIAQTEQVVGASEEEKIDHRAMLAARTALDLHRWKEAAALPDPAVRAEWKDTTEWARAIGAARSGNMATAQSSVNALKASVVLREGRARKQGYSVSGDKPSDLREAEAWLLFAQGKTEEALKEMREAAEHQEKNGGEGVGIPAREMLADMLLESKQAKGSLAEYQAALKNSPNRFDALLGAGRAAQALGDVKEAQTSYGKLAEICPPGADRPELAEAKTAMASK